MKKSKYMVIYEWLSDQIRDKKFQPGDRIPNETEIASMFNVHRMTVRQAINKLVGDHIIVRIRNKGTFLLSERSPVLTRTLDNVPTYHEDIVRAGLTPGYKTLETRVMTGDSFIASQLGLAETDGVIYAHRLIYASDVPIAIEKAYIPEGMFPGLHTMNLRTKSLITKQRGVALIELMIAMVILAIGLLGAVGLQARSLAAISGAGARVDATIAAERLIGLMWADQANLPAYAWNSTGGTAAPAVIGNWMAQTQAMLPNATAAIVVTPPVAPSTASLVSVTITWQRRTGASTDKNADQVNSHTIVATVAPTT